jgi:hypothetical protein
MTNTVNIEMALILGDDHDLCDANCAHDESCFAVADGDDDSDF